MNLRIELVCFLFLYLYLENSLDILGHYHKIVAYSLFYLFGKIFLTITYSLLICRIYKNFLENLTHNAD